MANFLPKERIEVQSTGAFGVDNLAKDISGLMTATQGVAETINKSMVSESEDVGKALARDALIEWKRTETSYNEARNSMGQQFYESVDNQPSAYEQTSKDLKMFMPQKLADVKENLGSDSVAYKAFEDHFLLQGTNLTENYKSELSKEHEYYAKIQLNQSAIKQANELGNDMGTENANALRISTKYTMTDDQFSKMFIDKVNGEFINSNVDLRPFVVGKKQVDYKNAKNEFNKHFSSVAEMKDDGSIVPKVGWLQQEDLARIKHSWDSRISSIQQANEYNMEFKLAKIDVANMKEMSSFSSTKEARDFADKTISYLQKKYEKSTSPSHEDTIAMYKYKEDMNVMVMQYGVAEEIANKAPSEVGQAITNKSWTTDKGSIAVEPQIVKKIYEKKLDSRFIDAFAEGNTLETSTYKIKSLIEDMKTSGVESPMLTATVNSFNSLSNKTVKDIKGNLSALKIINNAGYAWSTDKNGLDAKLIKDIEDTIIGSENSKFTEEQTKTAINETIIKRNAERRTDYSYLPSNASVISKAVKDDSFMQSATTNVIEGVMAGEVRWDNVKGGMSKVTDTMAKLATVQGIQLDALSTYDDTKNKDDLKKLFAGRTYIIDNPFWSAQTVMLPDLKNKAKGGDEFTPMNGEHFFDGVRGIVTDYADKKGKKLDVNWEKNIKLDYEVSKSDGVMVKIYANIDGQEMLLKKATGFEIESAYLYMKKNNKTVANTEPNYLTIQ